MKMGMHHGEGKQGHGPSRAVAGHPLSAGQADERQGQRVGQRARHIEGQVELQGSQSEEHHANWPPKLPLNSRAQARKAQHAHQALRIHHLLLCGLQLPAVCLTAGEASAPGRHAQHTALHPCRGPAG